MPKTILITGSTDGIGLLTAKKLAAEGHTLLLHGRSEEKLATAAKEVGRVQNIYRADLSKPGDVSDMASAVLADHERLDVLINNAGILKTPNTKTEAGRDIRFEVNTIAPYVLAQTLLTIIPKDGRIVNLSSAAQAKVDVAAMRTYRPMANMDAYAQSKLAITIWTAQMAESLPDGPAVTAVNPGSLLASKMVQEGFGMAGNDLNIGADILVLAALSPEFANASGKYFDNDIGRFGSPDPAASSAAHVDGIMSALADISGQSRTVR